MTTAEKLNKVAEITLLFWLMKVLATTLGRTSGDFLSMTLNLGYLTGLFITAGFFLLVLMIQLSSTEYKPVYYWLLIISRTTVGTEISDFMDRSLHLGCTVGSFVQSANLCVLGQLSSAHAIGQTD